VFLAKLLAAPSGFEKSKLDYDRFPPLWSSTKTWKY